MHISLCDSTTLLPVAVKTLETPSPTDLGVARPSATTDAGTVVSLGATVDALRAVGEPTRARIVALLRHGECSVSDLSEILGQSQPGISRHLRQLHDAGLVTRHREGSFIFFGLSSSSEEPVRSCLAVIDSVDDRDRMIAGDRRRLEAVRERRAVLAHDHFASHAGDWERESRHSAHDEDVLPVILDMLSSASRGLGRVLDIGTGTGRMAQLLAPTAERVVGLDPNPTMLRVARANLDRSGIHHVELRQGDVFHPPFPTGSFDLVVCHQVLHFLDDADRAIAEMADLLDEGGRLLIVDLPAHGVEELRRDHAHRRLGFSSSQMTQWIKRAGLGVVEERHVKGSGGRLDSVIWLAAGPGAGRGGR
jgi:SAM-dependent methyltransferase